MRETSVSHQKEIHIFFGSDSDNTLATCAEGSVTYTYMAEEFTFDDARANCQALGGDLAMPRTEQEFADLTAVLGMTKVAALI